MDVPAKFGASPEILIARSIGLQRTRRSYAKLHRLRSWVVGDYAKVIANGAQTHDGVALLFLLPLALTLALVALGK
jgi:hypothetical protein